MFSGKIIVRFCVDRLPYNKLMLTDGSLLERYVAGDDHAFTALVRRYLNAVYSWALRRVGGDAHLAQDVVQQVFIGLARDAHRLSARTVLTGWLYVATRNAAANEVRRERRRKIHEQEAQAMHDTLSQGSPEVDWSAVAPVLEDAMDRLVESDRVAVLLRFSDRRSFSEIGGILRVSEEAARKRVDRAVDKLHGLLSRRGVATSSATLGLALANHAVVAAPEGLAGTVAGTSMAFAAANPPVVGFLSFMSTTKIVSATTAVILALAIGTGSYEASSLRRTEIARDQMTREFDALLAKRRDLEQRALVAGSNAAVLRQQIHDERAAQAEARARKAAQAQAANKAVEWDPVTQGDAFMVRHPEVRRALHEWTVARVNLRYGALYKNLRLTPGQITQFQTLMLEKFGKFGPPLGSNGEVLELRAGNGLSENDVSKGLRELVGEDGYRKYIEFERMGTAQMFTEQIASALCFTDTPLTTHQTDELINIMATSQAATDASKARRFDWDAVTAKAQGVLAPPQLAALTGMRAQDEFQQAFNGFRASPPPAASLGGSVPSR
jgi:RNA polymerase sigma factor (sigma-70 family)